MQLPRTVVKSLATRGQFTAISSPRCFATRDTERSDLSQDISGEADTVVIGGGAVGCSIAYHLAKGAKTQSVILLEKSELTAGSTWHAAGLTTTYHPLIEKESGQQVGLHQPGSLRLAATPLRIDEFQYQIARQGWNDAPMELWTPEDIRKRIPIMDIEGAGILGGLFTPLDGHIDPYSLTQAIAVGARRHGAKIYQRAEVTEVKPLSDGSWEVSTPLGAIRAKKVVNASGFWAKEVAEKHGLFLPLVPIHHQYLVTKSVPDVQKELNQELPVLRDLDGSYYLRQERDGLLIGPYESPESMKLSEDWTRSGVPPGFGKELFEPDLDRLQPHLEAAMKLMPCFQSAEIQSVVNGPITYSPDVLPLIGPTRLANMWLAVGFGYGIAHCGGAGKYLADWILNGEPSFDLVECDPDRFMNWADVEYALQKSRETYGMNNAYAYPNEDRPAGRPTKLRGMGPIHQDLLRAGAFMGFHNGWESPEWFAGKGQTAEYKPSFRRTNWHDHVNREYECVMKGVGLKDLSTFAKFEVSGEQAEPFLDRVVAGGVPKTVGRATVAHALTHTGKVYAELTLTRVDENKFLVITGGGVEGHDLRHLEQVARDEKYNVSITNVTDSTSALGIAGPKASGLFDAVTAKGSAKAADFRFLDAKKCRIGQVDVLAIRISYTGELGWEFYMEKDGMKAVYDCMIEEGKSFDLGHFGNFALNTLRLEKGFKLWGNEMNLDVDILEAGLDGFVRWKKKANFIGRAAIESRRFTWRQQQLVMLSIDVSDADPEGNESIWIGSKVVGNLTSGCYSPHLGQGLAFGYIPAIAANPGTEVHVEIMDEKRKATVLSGPPLATQPVRERMKMKDSTAS